MPELIVRKWDGPYSFMVFREEGLYKARRGDNGSIQFEDPQLHEVLNNVWNALTPNRTWKERVVLKGNFQIASTIKIPSYTFLDLRWARLESALSSGYMLENSDTVKGNREIVIESGFLDGNGIANTAAIHLSADPGPVEECVIRNVHTYNFGSASGTGEITLYKAKDCLLENLKIEKHGKIGIVAQYCEACELSNIRMWNSTGTSESGIACPNSSFFSIHDVWLDGEDVNPGEGLDLYDFDDSLIARVFVWGWQGDAGIAVHDGCERLDFIECHSWSNKNDGFKTTMSNSEINFIRCRAYKNGSEGFAIYNSPNSQVISCHSLENAEYGIFIGYQGNCVVKGCISRDNPHGIRMYNSSYNVIVGNRCYNTAAGQTQEYGVSEGGNSDHNVIIGNNLAGNNTGALLIVGANTLYRTATDNDPLNIT